jgi:hypothetical protein
MANFTDLFDFEVKHLEDGSIEILDLCNYPQESKKCFYLHKYLDLININNSCIDFPIHLKYWTVTITPDTEDIIKKYYSIDGIKILLDENIAQLQKKITFFKPEISFPPNADYPNFILHFYQVVEAGGKYLNIIDAIDMFEACLVHYEDTEKFTEERIKDLDKLVSVAELQQIPFLPIEEIKFDKDGKIEQIKQHIQAKNACK